MRKVLSILFFFIIFLSSFNLVFAQQEIEIKTSSPSAENTCVNYALPYPGLLPDNPLYFLKTIRDAITRFFISDPFEKAEYDLLQADKNLNTGYYLFFKNSGKDKMVSSVIVKAEKSFENAINETVRAKEQGTDVLELLDKMTISLQKHKEVLTEIKNGISITNIETINNELKRVQDFKELVNKIKSK